MTTLKTAVVPAKQLKSGKHKIRIAVGHKKQTRYLVTRFVIDDLSQFRDGQVVNDLEAPAINSKLRNLLNEYQDALDKINTDAYTCGQIVEYLSRFKRTSSTFNSVAKEMISEMKEEGRKGTAGLYELTLRYFNECTYGKMMLDMIVPKTIKDFDLFLNKEKGLNATTRGIHMAHVKAIINSAIRDKIVSYETHPFEYYVKPAPEVRELDISVEEFKKIRDSDFPEKSLRVARDVFLLSYYLGGINLIDLMNINFKNATTIEYVREKSKNTKRGEKKISLSIPPEAQPIIKTWIGRNGKLNFGYKFSYGNFRNYVTKELQRLADRLELNKHVVYYSARKSLVQHGFELGIPLEVLEYCIGQSVKKNRPIFNYVKIMRKHADEAIRKILDSLK
ncbi:tyrosine-type recombinase/integrase [Bacteroides sp.]|uniref:tyrosine-type recombinase/integrase n=1 Tax=Bacteroides sp. TaxID=29523 RepID=UPI003D1308F2